MGVLILGQGETNLPLHAERLDFPVCQLSSMLVKVFVPGASEWAEAQIQLTWRCAGCYSRICVVGCKMKTLGKVVHALWQSVVIISAGVWEIVRVIVTSTYLCAEGMTPEAFTYRTC